MVKNCYRCGRNNKTDQDVTLFTIPTKFEGSEWHTEFMKRLGVEDNIEEDEVHVCSTHFRPEDIEIDGCIWTLKENSLPVDNDAELGEELIVNPEVVYVKCQRDDDSLSDSNEAKELARLEPLVEYTYEEEEECKGADLQEHYEVDGDGEIQDGNHENGIVPKSEYVSEQEESKAIKLEDGNLEVEPMMPFFLSSSPVFTIVNENNEVGETIILQIDKPEKPKKKPALTADELTNLQNSLCPTRKGNIIGEYTCDICENSYGCLNCLKSHYETCHTAGLVTIYKCEQSHYVSRSMVCPVCNMVFPTRSETLDHYITHSVACDICGSGFDRQEYLMDHYKTTHPKTTYDTSYLCELCKNGYQHAASLAKHYQNFHHMILCYVCKLRFINVHELQDHESVHREKLEVLPYACSKCDKAFPKISDIVVHIRTDHKKEVPKRVPKVQKKKVVDVIKVPLQKRVKVKK